LPDFAREPRTHPKTDSGNFKWKQPQKLHSGIRAEENKKLEEEGRRKRYNEALDL